MIKITKRKNMVKRAPTKMQVFDLKDEDDAEKYYALIEYMTSKKLALPILAKGTMRLIDLGINKAKKVDKEIQALLTSTLPWKEQLSIGLNS